MKFPLNSIFTLAAAVGIFANPANAAIIVDLVEIGNPGNAGDTQAGATTFGLGAVSSTFYMAKNEVTVTQYVAFLNAVAKTDTYNLYNPLMDSSTIAGGITRTGSPGTYAYSVKSGMGNKPITYVSWLDAARFANWMHNGQPTGAQNASSTEDGAYTLNGALTAAQGGAVTRNSGATIWLPSESEWYKAAFYDPNRGGPGSAGYWATATQSASLASNTIGAADSANFKYLNVFTSGINPSGIRVTDAGAYGTNSTSAYGTNDQAGNVREFTDTYFGSGSRYLRGGSWNDVSATRSTRASLNVDIENEFNGQFNGFRIAAIPEPSTALFSVIAIASSVCRRKRRSN